MLDEKSRGIVDVLEVAMEYSVGTRDVEILT